jgi:hypothetical protein
MNLEKQVWEDRAYCPSVQIALREYFEQRDCFADLPPRTEDPDLMGLTILDRPHITAAGTIGCRLYDWE